MLSPFIFPVKGMLNEGVNHLEVIVTNTLANAVNDEAVQARWTREFPKSYYTPMQRAFEQESLPSGLTGPVVLRADDGNESILLSPSMEENQTEKHCEE